MTFLVREEGAVARRATVALHLVTHTEFVVEHARHFELHGADEAVVPGALGQRREIAQPGGGVIARDRRVETRRSRRRLRGILRETNLRAMLGERVALEIGRPQEAELVHQGLAPVAGRETEGTTRGQRPVQDGAHGRIHRAQEHLQVGGAFHFDQGEELVHLHARVLLLLVVQNVGHDGLVVGDVHAERDRDRLTAAVVRQLVGLTDGVARRAAHARRRRPRQAQRQP